MDNGCSIPLVLAIGGHDPSGGAGLQADIEAIAANGCRALSVVTALTTQNTCGIIDIYVQPAAQVEAQCRLLLEESAIKVVKLGLLGNAQVVTAIVRVLDDFPKLQTILDPVLAVGNDNKSLADAELQLAIREQLLPRCTLATPNSPEARILGGHGDLARCADAIIAYGSAAVLITGSHELSDLVVNRLYTLAGLVREYNWPRLPASYHGSGCTLTAAIAAKLALGQPLTGAVEAAQAYTWNSLQHALHNGLCQWLPNRFYANEK